MDSGFYVILQDIEWRQAMLLTGCVPNTPENLQWALDAIYVLRTDQHGLHAFLPDRLFVLFRDVGSVETFCADERNPPSLYLGRFGEMFSVVAQLFSTLLM